MKRILTLFLAIICLLSLFSCGKDEEYPPVESTDEEARVMMTIELDGEKYEVRYELYRALFLNFSKKYDKGDKSFWDTEASASAKTELNSRIISFCTDIFSALHLSKKIGYDPYSAATDEKIKEYISKSVNGYSDNSGSFIGFDGNYDAYLASLKEMNLNYSVQTLLLRYSIALDNINLYYAGTIDENDPTLDMKEGALIYTEEDVRSFYYGNESARVLLVTLDTKSYTENRAKEIRDKMATYTNAYSVSSYIVGFTATTPEDAFNGVLLGKYSLDSAYYSEIIKEAFSLAEGETGDVIRVSTDTVSNYHILYKTDKSDEYYSENYIDVRNVYIANRIGELLNEVKLTLAENVKRSELFDTIKHSEISMK